MCMYVSVYVFLQESFAGENTPSLVTDVTSYSPTIIDWRSNVYLLGPLPTGNR